VRIGRGELAEESLEEVGVTLSELREEVHVSLERGEVLGRMDGLCSRSDGHSWKYSTPLG
jgi:hypothetical protein